jgi:hypothetical protein
MSQIEVEDINNFCMMSCFIENEHTSMFVLLKDGVNCQNSSVSARSMNVCVCACIPPGIK